MRRWSMVGIAALSLLGCSTDDTGDDTGPAMTSDTGAMTGATSPTSADETSASDSTGAPAFDLGACTAEPQCGLFFMGDCTEGGDCDAYEPALVCALEALRDAAAFSAGGECCGLGPYSLTTIVADGSGTVLRQQSGMGDTDPTPWLGEVERCTPMPPEYFTDCLANVQQSCRHEQSWWSECETVQAPTCP